MPATIALNPVAWLVSILTPLLTPPRMIEMTNNATNPTKAQSGERVQSPTYYPSAPAGATAQCRDGTFSFSRNHRGRCSHLGGVSKWLD
jgi:Protein of unknown function (DUF3761)